MQCHAIKLDTTGTTYTFYKKEKNRETIKEKTKTKHTNRKGKKSIRYSSLTPALRSLESLSRADNEYVGEVKLVNAW